MSDVPVVCFGPNENSYYVGCGLRYYAPNMPVSMSSTLPSLPPIQISWISIDCTGQIWAANNAYNKSTTHYDTRLKAEVVDFLKNGYNYLTFGPEADNYFVAKQLGTWQADANDTHIKQINEVRKLVNGFDQGLSGIIFGKGTTQIFLFPGGFSWYTDKEAEESELEKVLNEFMAKGPGWTIERGSSLAFYNVNYYYLKFKNPANGEIQMRWSMPTAMFNKVDELRKAAQTPEAQAAIQKHESNAMALATANLNMAVATSNAMSALFFHR